MTPKERTRAGHDNDNDCRPSPTRGRMPDLTIRLSTYQEGQVFRGQCQARWTDGHNVVARAVLRYLEDAARPRTMRATIERGTRRAHYLILLGDNDICLYLHVGLFSVDGSNIYDVQTYGGRRAVRSYDLRFYANRHTPIHGEQIECRHAGIPGRLARIGAKYLANEPGQGAMMVATTATTTSGHRTKYALVLDDGSLNVYRYVSKYTIVEITE